MANIIIAVVAISAVPLLRKGEKIKAIKLYRERTRLGLKEAHNYIQELDLGEKDENLSD